jgi:hypothetical protein
LFGASVELADGYDGELQLFGEEFDGTGELGDFELAGLDLLADVISWR